MSANEFPVAGQAGEVPGVFDEQLKSMQLKNLEALTRKAKAEAEAAEDQNLEQKKRRDFLSRILSTTQGAVLLALVTLIFQILQFGWTASENRKAYKERAWRDAVSSLSFQGGEKSVGSVLNVETFFKSPEHSQDAKALVAGVLPSIKNDEAFDNAFFVLLNATSVTDKTYHVYDTARQISEKYRDEIADQLGSHEPIGPDLLSARLIAGAARSRSHHRKTP